MNMVSLGEIATFYSGGTPKRSAPEFWTGEIPWITGADISETGVIKPRSYITQDAVNNSATKVLPKNTLVLVTRTSVGKVGILSQPTAFSQDITGILPNSNLALGYLAHFLKSQGQYFANHARGATIKGVTRNVVESLRIPVPPLSVQHRIIEILDRADALHEKRRQYRLKIQEFEQAIFYKMFAQTRAEQRHVRLGDVVSLQSGGTPSKSIPDYWDGAVPWFSAKDIKKANLNDSQDHVAALALERTNLRLLPKNTVVLVVRGMILAHTLPVATLRVPATINQDLKALIPRESANVDFLAAALRSRSKWLLSRTSTSAHGTRRLETTNLMETPVPDVSVKDQMAFAERMMMVRAQTSNLEEIMQLENELFASLQSRAFRGEL